jgi:hypothetical protein
VTVDNPAPSTGPPNGLTFTIQAPLPPSIASFVPASGPLGTAVTIAGLHFTGTSRVATPLDLGRISDRFRLFRGFHPHIPPLALALCGAWW